MDKDKVLERLGKRLAEKRKEKCLSQEHLAFHAGISVSHVSRIERGLLNCSVTVLVALAEVLEIKPGELID
jgi:transcriptional regulator with XRE-family HTH domain